jgi:hypothetical protein
LIGQEIFSRQTLEKRAFPLLGYIAYTTLHYTTVHAGDTRVMIMHNHEQPDEMTRKTIVAYD